jgi:anti-sigma regulatory factor (Ser/Thr protein kinase)
LEFLEKSCAARNIEADLISRARVVIEELFTNTIKYGYGGECDRPVRLRLAFAHDLTVTYEDDAPSFDSTRWQSSVPLAAPGDRPVGQAGIPLVLGLSATLAYRRLSESGGNRLTITLAPSRA